jgi:hypothetical protein
VGFQGRSSLPQQGIGYTRGSDFIAGGSGSGMGMASQGTASLGQGLSSLGGGSWEPSVLYLIGLMIGEMVVFHVLGRVLSR